MKINYITVSDIPSKNANSLQIVQMCNALSEIGNDVKLIIPNLSKTNKSIKDYYGVKSNFEVIKVGENQKEISRLQNIIIPVKLFLKSLFIKSDLIITRNLVLSFLFILFRKKHIIEIHDDLEVSGKLLSKLYIKLNLLNSKSIIKIIFITLRLKKFISSKYKYNKENYKILPDATAIFENKKLNSCKQNLKIGYFGSIYKSRGIETIIKLSLLDNNNDYYIYGGLKSEISRLKKKFQKNNLKIYPQIPYRLVKNKISEMDVLLMPYKKKVTTTGDISNISEFMSPMKMFDYLGSAKIILSANLPVLREVLKNKKNCILIKNYMNIKSWLIEIKKIKFNYDKFIIIQKKLVN